jgi:K+-sensing histidine kinase KdpD
MSVRVENESRRRTASWVAIRRWIAANTFAPAWLTPAWSRHASVGYLTASLLQVLTALATLVLVRVFPLLKFQDALSLLVIALVALNWGAGPGLLAVLVGGAVHDYVVLPPQFSWTLTSNSDVASLVLFLIVGLTISIIGSRAGRARREAHAARTVAETAQRTAEALTRRLHALQAVTETALAHLDIDNLQQQLLDRITQVLAVDNTVILLVDETGQELVVHMAHGPEEQVAGQVRVPIGQGIAGQIAASREPLIVDDLRTVEVVNPLLREQIRSLMGVPLVVQDRVIGVLHVGTRALRHFTEDDLRLLHLVAGRIALALDHARLYEAQRSARAQATTQAAELAAVFDAITDGILVYDREGHLLRSNAAARAINDLLEQPGYRDRPFAERLALAAPRDAEGPPVRPADAPISRVLRGEVFTGANAVDSLVRLADGHEVLLNVTGAPIRDAEGHVSGAVIVNRDVTGRRLLERRTHEALDAVLTMAEAVVLVPDDTAAGEEQAVGASRAAMRRLAELTRRVLGCHGVAILALDPETDILHQMAAAVLSPEQERYWQTMVEGRRLGERLGAAALAHLRAGDVLTLDMARPPLRELPNPFGVRIVLVAPVRIGERLIGLLGINSGDDRPYTPDEMTLAGAVARLTALVIERERLLRERAQAQATELALRETTRRMDEFLSIAAHELRTPLTSLKGYLQLAEQSVARGLRAAQAGGRAGLSTLNTVHPMLQQVDVQISRIERLTNDLVDVSRIQAGRLAMQLMPCDLVPIVVDAVREQTLTAPTRTIDVVVPPGAAVTVLADADRIGQVVTNYLTNALKYSADDKPVTVGLEVNSAMARISVHDTGPGIPAAEQERIWERFYRVAGIEHRSGSGIGLGMGLYISRTIVERHHGHVGVESHPGSGSTFWFTLPLRGDWR